VKTSSSPARSRADSSSSGLATRSGGSGTNSLSRNDTAGRSTGSTAVASTAPATASTSVGTTSANATSVRRSAVGTASSRSSVAASTTAATTANPNAASIAVSPVSDTYACDRPTTASPGSSATSGHRTRNTSSSASAVAASVASGTNSISSASGRAGHVDCSVSRHESVSPPARARTVSPVGSPATVVGNSIASDRASRPSTSTSTERHGTRPGHRRHAATTRYPVAATSSSGSTSAPSPKTGANSSPGPAEASRTATTAVRELTQAPLTSAPPRSSGGCRPSRWAP
jgi:hypothetical protein